MKSIIVFVAIIFIFSLSASAHTPVDISVTPDFAQNKATISVYHPTNGASEEYVRTIEAKAGGDEPVIYNFTFQKGNYQSVVVDLSGSNSAGNITVNACHNTCLEKNFNISR